MGVLDSMVSLSGGFIRKRNEFVSFSNSSHISAPSIFVEGITNRQNLNFPEGNWCIVLMYWASLLLEYWLELLFNPI
jgi:hypothetical protein